MVPGHGGLRRGNPELVRPGKETRSREKVHACDVSRKRGALMKRKKRRIDLFVVPLIAWLGVLAIGMALSHDVELQNVPGYPNRGQLVLYVFLPLSLIHI